jgi:Kef-type K+ transport system membrane component KefB
MDSHTLIQALIYLGSAALIVPIAVRQAGVVLGYLIAGCIIRGGSAGHRRRVSPGQSASLRWLG